VRRAFVAAHEWLGRRTYEDSARARKIVHIVLQICDELVPAQEAQRVASAARSASSEAEVRSAAAEAELHRAETELSDAERATYHVSDENRWFTGGFCVGGAVAGLWVFNLPPPRGRRTHMDQE